MATEREDHVTQAKMAEQAERYDGEWDAGKGVRGADEDPFLPHAEMVESMKAVATKFAELTVEERNLLSVAYKNVIGARRASWRIIQSIEHKEEGRGGSKLELIRNYRNQVEKELKDICQVSLLSLARAA